MKEIKQDVENCKVYKFQCENRVIYFEKDEYKTHSQGFIVAKEGCNSRFIKTGGFPIYSFNPDFVKEANIRELVNYFTEKSLSEHYNNFCKKKN